MHPAFSIIIFTTFSSAGYGLAALMSLGLLPAGSVTGFFGYGLALALISAGLVASTFHLKRPERAWRALSQWRSSWLSREGVLALVTYAPLAIVAVAWTFYGTYVAWLGWLTALLCIATVFATSMIYASLRTVERWYSRLTPALYLAFGLSGGLVLASFTAAASGYRAPMLFVAALFGILAYWCMQFAWWLNGDRLATTSTPETATGLGHLGKVRLLERPHFGDNYLTREMGFRVARKHATKLRLIAALIGLALPLLTIAAALLTPLAPLVTILLALAALLHLGGTLIARWLFFAEARHTVMTYYGTR